MPSIEVLGVYLPEGDRIALERAVQEEMRILEGHSQSRRRAHEARFRQDLRESALIEVLVAEPDDRFDVGDFCQPDPQRPEGDWQAAWCESFLAADGESPVSRDLALSHRLKVFRVAFYIHYWQSERGLQSSYGPLDLPSPQALPARLWQLAPYCPVT
jgi:hypothetical protein